MALIVGLNTYISAADALAYVAGYYTSADPKALAWLSLSETDKEVHLRQAARLIDNQPLAGIRCTREQLMEFPRFLSARYIDDWSYPEEIVTPEAVTPEAVKQAQVEIALVLNHGVPMRTKLQREGVKSFSVGKISETFAGPGAFSRIPSPEAIELLRPYLAGSVSIV